MPISTGSIGASRTEVAGNPVADLLAAQLDRAVVHPVDETGPNIAPEALLAFQLARRRDIENSYARQARDEYLSVLIGV